MHTYPRHLINDCLRDSFVEQVGELPGVPLARKLLEELLGNFLIHVAHALVLGVEKPDAKLRLPRQKVFFRINNGSAMPLLRCLQRLPGLRDELRLAVAVASTAAIAASAGLAATAV